MRAARYCKPLQERMRSILRLAAAVRRPLLYRKKQQSRPLQGRMRSILRLAAAVRRPLLYRKKQQSRPLQGRMRSILRLAAAGRRVVIQYHSAWKTCLTMYTIPGCCIDWKRRCWHICRSGLPYWIPDPQKNWYL